MLKFQWTNRGENNFSIQIKTDHIEQGTLYRLTGAIYALGFDIESGTIKSEVENGVELAVDEFQLRYIPEGSQKQPDPSLLGVLMESVINTGADLETFLNKHGYSTATAEFRHYFEIEPTILFQDQPADRVTQFYIETIGRRGLLFQLTRFLFQAGIDIQNAIIKTNSSEVAEDTFYLSYQGNYLKPELIARLEEDLLTNSPAEP